MSEIFGSMITRVDGFSTSGDHQHGYTVIELNGDGEPFHLMFPAMLGRTFAVAVISAVSQLERERGDGQMHPIAVEKFSATSARASDGAARGIITAVTAEGARLDLAATKEELEKLRVKLDWLIANTESATPPN